MLMLLAEINYLEISAVGVLALLGTACIKVIITITSKFIKALELRDTMIEREGRRNRKTLRSIGKSVDACRVQLEVIQRTGCGHTCENFKGKKS